MNFDRTGEDGKEMGTGETKEIGVLKADIDHILQELKEQRLELKEQRLLELSSSTKVKLLQELSSRTTQLKRQVNIKVQEKQ
jgi:hypothetical protein